MRRGLLVVGIIVLIVGLVLVLLPFVATTTESIPAGSVLTITPAFVGSGTVTLSWSGAPSATQVRLFECANAQCAPGAAVASAQGGSGSISATLQGGRSYGISTSGTGNANVDVTLKVVGLTPLVLVGIVLLVLGAILAGLAFRKRRAAPAPAVPAAPAPSAGGGAAPDALADQVYAAAAPPPEPAAGERAPLTCAYCGTVNEVWLTNCRKCKRPLLSTA